jgi:hypothetical protein
VVLGDFFKKSADNNKREPAIADYTHSVRG